MDVWTGAEVQVCLPGPHWDPTAQLPVLWLQTDRPVNHPAGEPGEFQDEARQHEVSQHQRPGGAVRREGNYVF